MTSNRFDFLLKTLDEQTSVSGFPLVYKGELNHQITKLFTSMAESKIKRQHGDGVLIRRVYHVMVECLQNITKHSDDFDNKENPIGHGMFIAAQDDKAFYVVTGNKINVNKVDDLKGRIQELNKSDKDKLNTTFKKQMKEGRISEKGGAGLGLIDMIRKTGIPLEFDFSDVDDNYMFFLLKVTIPIKF